jgi:hypothetical protein
MSETDQLSPSDKLAATLAALEAERAARVQAGRWGRGTLPMLIAIPRDGETLQAAKQRALYAYLSEHPDAPKNVSAYNWIEGEVLDPEPTIEPPSVQYTADHRDAVAVTPRPLPPPPSPPPAPPREKRTTLAASKGYYQSRHLPWILPNRQPLPMLTMVLTSVTVRIGLGILAAAAASAACAGSRGRSYPELLGLASAGEVVLPLAFYEGQGIN